MALFHIFLAILPAVITASLLYIVHVGGAGTDCEGSALNSHVTGYLLTSALSRCSRCHWPRGGDEGPDASTAGSHVGAGVTRLKVR